MFLHLLKNIGLSEIWLAGFDGYTQDNSVNYYGDYIRLLYCQDNVILRNEAIKKELCEMQQFMRISSLTPTRYL
jgi:4-hydroxy 2-oxovalerate aldolase